MPDRPLYPIIESGLSSRPVEQVVVGMRNSYNSHEEVKISKQEARLASLLSQGYQIIATLPYIDDAIFFLYYGKV